MKDEVVCIAFVAVLPGTRRWNEWVVRGWVESKGVGGRGGDWLTTLKMLVELENYSIKCITGETWIGNQTELHTERRAGGG